MVISTIYNVYSITDKNQTLFPPTLYTSWDRCHILWNYWRQYLSVRSQRKKIKYLVGGEWNTLHFSTIVKTSPISKLYWIMRLKMYINDEDQVNGSNLYKNIWFFIYQSTQDKGNLKHFLCSRSMPHSTTKENPYKICNISLQQTSVANIQEHVGPWWMCCL